MSKLFGQELHDFDRAQSFEWLETNGLGGYASSTAGGSNSRRYHGLLVAAVQPPVGRIVVLSKLDETVVTGNERIELSSNQYPGAVHPQGYQLLTSFRRELFPEFTFRVRDIVLRKTIVAIQDENTTLIAYDVLQASGNFEMEFLPLCSARDYHSLSHANDAIYTDYIFSDGLFQTKNYVSSPELFIYIPASQFEPSRHWYYNLELARERERGLDFKEDLFSHGKFTVSLKKGDSLVVLVSTEDPQGRDAHQLYQTERRRRENLVAPYAWSEPLQRLVLAADQFIVKRGADLKTIIAGYHWFTDWGRDTMIALPGLCLATRRYDDAKKILKAFAGSVSEGMLPNRFPDHGEAPEYNTVDATLWFFQAVYNYYKTAADRTFVAELLPALREIIKWHDRGTRYHIHVAEDGLLYAGQPGVQLTWMDARIGDWIVTPRQGKAIEVNALWFNALSIMAELTATDSSAAEAADFKKRAQTVRTNFNKVFWNEKLGYLFDFVDGEYRNEDVRPNAIYAIALPFQLLPREKAEKVFSIATRQLLTPRGLRSLSPRHPDYKPICDGDQWSRDGAYHQGTAWSFLLGIYIDSVMLIKGEKGRVESSRILVRFLSHLDEAGVGTVSEIFDGEPPHHPRGCIAQAWSVGEVLRVALQYDLFPDRKMQAIIS